MKIAVLKGGVGIYADLIRKLTGGTFTHVALVLDQTVDGDPLVVEATWWSMRVHLSLWSTYSSRPRRVYQDVNNEQSLGPIKDMIGHSSYGYKQALGYLLKRIFRLGKNPLNEGEFCNEVAHHWVLWKEYGGTFNDYDPNEIDPTIFERLLSENANFKLIENVE